MSLSFETLTGPAIAPVLDDVARLRIAVFREWPYLYDGDPGYERRYLSVLANNPTAVAVLARDAAGRIVGAATGLRIDGADAEFAEPFALTDLPPSQTFYLAESVLLPAFRGQGAGHAFFAARERHARALGLRWAALLTVIRPDHHPARPADYRPLDGFWWQRGYRPLMGVVAEYRWKDLGDPHETAHPMQFWARDLTAP